jgi:hypothetical protein
LSTDQAQRTQPAEISGRVRDAPLRAGSAATKSLGSICKVNRLQANDLDLASQGSAVASRHQRICIAPRHQRKRHQRTKGIKAHALRVRKRLHDRSGTATRSATQVLFHLLVRFIHTWRRQLRVVLHVLSSTRLRDRVPDRVRDTHRPTGEHECQAGALHGAGKID